MTRAGTATVWPNVRLALTVPAALMATASPACAKDASTSSVPQKKAPQSAQAHGRASVVIVSDIVRIKLGDKGRVIFETPAHYTRSVEKDGTQLINLQ